LTHWLRDRIVFNLEVLPMKGVNHAMKLMININAKKASFDN